MKNKKNIVITFRVEEDIKEKIDKLASKKEWSVSQVVEYICKDYFSKRAKYGSTPAEAVKNYYERIEEELSEIPLDNFNNNEDLVNEIFRLIEI